jgi:hypothetical protein
MHPMQDDESRYVKLSGNIMKYLLIVTLLSLSSFTNATLTSYTNASIEKIMQWEGNGNIVFVLSSGASCFSPETEKNIYSLILSLYATKNLADVHCYSDTEVMGGFNVQKVHRIIAKYNMFE